VRRRRATAPSGPLGPDAAGERRPPAAAADDGRDPRAAAARLSADRRRAAAALRARLAPLAGPAAALLTGPAYRAAARGPRRGR
jgi:hypothetical protein